LTSIRRERANVTTDAATTEAATVPGVDVRRTRLAGILREIAVGGIAALLTGIVVGGIGGRIVMRVATLLVPDAAGLTTENGNRIGTFTLEGSFALLLFGGIAAGVVAASIWVIVRPWLPGARGTRMLASIPVAIAFGTSLLIEADNIDFAILHHDPAVVASLVILIAIAGPAIVLVDDWLDRRLPAIATGREPATVVYTVVAAVGLLVTLAMTVPGMYQIGGLLLVLPIAAVGLATLALWARRVRGEEPGPELRWIGRGALSVAVVIGLADALGDIGGALGIP
jgi:hypothetical protein